MTTAPILDNAVARSEQSADFEIPAYAERANIAPGDFAKVCCAGERFWLRVERNNGCGRYVGTIDNNLVRTPMHGLQCGDRISFEARHVFDIYAEVTR
jgi:hypothetical protein